MAMINNIRKQKKFLFVIIVIAMLLFLIPYDAIMSYFGQGQNMNAGEIDGVTVSQVEFQNALKKRESLNLRYNDNSALSDAVWRELVESKLFASQYDELGISVSEEELEEIMYGENISAFVKSTFYGQSGVTDESRDQVRNYIDGLAPSVADEFRIMIANNRKKEKWETVVNKGMYANPVDAQIDYEFKNDKVNFEYVYKKYADIDDSEISFDESDVRAYYNKHKGEDKFVQIDARDIDFVEFAIIPSATDSSDVRGKISSIASEWRIAKDDSLFFMSKKTEKPYYQPLPYKDGDFAAVNDTIKLAPKGAVFGPFLNKANLRAPELSYTIAKVVDVVYGPDTVSAQHILIKGTGDLTVQLAKLDSIKQVIESGTATFEEMALQYSEDVDQEGKLNSGGIYENVTRGQMVPTFNDFIFNKQVGSRGIVETPYGVHLVEVLTQNESKRTTMTASISRKIPVSSITMKSAYKEAEKFRNSNRSASEFDVMADSLGLKQNWDGITSRSKGNGALQDATTLVNWAHKATTSVGDISTPIQVKGKYIVAHLTAIKEKGIPEFKHVQERMETEVIKEKKFELYSKKMDGTSLDAIATEIEGTKEIASNVSKTSASIPKVSGKEEQVVGFAFAIANGEISNPIQGNTGIWVIAPSDIVKAEAKDQYVTEQATLQNSQLKATAVRTSMIKEADVDDARFQ